MQQWKLPPVDNLKKYIIINIKKLIKVLKNDKNYHKHQLKYMGKPEINK